MSVDESTLRLANTVRCTTAEGPFTRYAIWVRGCTIRCPGCCNPELFDATGPTTSVDALVHDIAIAQAELGIEGITLLGGEPTEQMPAVSYLAERVQTLGLGVLLFTGVRIATLKQQTAFSRLWQAIDTLVDGPYLATQPEPQTGRILLGSMNQTIHHRTTRYAAPELWHASPTIEVMIDGLDIQAHGPAGILEQLHAHVRARHE